MYMCSDIVKGRGVCLKFARSSWLLALRVYSLALWVFCGRSCDSGGGFVGGCIVAGLWWFNCRHLVWCSRSKGGIISACGVVIVLVSWLMFLMIGKFSWVFHAVAFLASSISCSLTAGGVDACMSFQ